MSWYKKITISNASLTKQSSVISFDFDDTLTLPYFDEEDLLWRASLEPQKHILDKMLQYHSEGHKVIITTFRHRSAKNVKEIAEFIAKHNLPLTIEDVIFTGFRNKGDFLSKNKVEKHYDDDPNVVEDAKKYKIKVELVPHPAD